MGDEDDLVKAGVEGAVGGIVAPFADLLNKLVGPAAEALGLTLKDQVQFFRLKRYKRLMERSKLMFDNMQREPEQVELKLLLPILEIGSLEENDELQDRWAALLVNSSGKNTLLPGAPDILRQLAPFEVLLLQLCYDFVCGPYDFLDLGKKPLNDIVQQWYVVLVEKHRFKKPGMEHHRDLGVMIDNLTRLGLLIRKPSEGTPRSFYMTPLGFEFVGLCQTHLKA